jgi:hypothetical protein
MMRGRFEPREATLPWCRASSGLRGRSEKIEGRTPRVNELKLFFCDFYQISAKQIDTFLEIQCSDFFSLNSCDRGRANVMIFSD